MTEREFLAACIVCGLDAGLSKKLGKKLRREIRTDESTESRSNRSPFLIDESRAAPHEPGSARPPCLGYPPR